MRRAYSNLRDCFTTFAMTGFVLCYVAEIYKFHEKQGGGVEFRLRRPHYLLYCLAINYLFIAFSTATATATVAPTIGLLPMPIRPIISTCAGTEDEPANCASECIRPMVSVIP